MAESGGASARLSAPVYFASVLLVTLAGFGAAMRSLLPFPSVVDMLCQQIDWTRQVGSAFTSDRVHAMS